MPSHFADAFDPFFRVETHGNSVETYGNFWETVSICVHRRDEKLFTAESAEDAEKTS